MPMIATPLRGAAAVLCLLLLAPSPVDAQSTLDGRTRAKAKVMLRDVRDAIKDYYYDPTFHGVDIDARFTDTQTKLDTARSLGHAMALIAQFVLELGDSHTYFVPPMRAESYDYGWQMQMIGDDCFVTAVKPGSDAEAQGLKPGDRLLRIDVFLPKRGELWKVQYLYYVLSPRTSLKVVVQSPGAAPRELELKSKVTKGQKLVNLSTIDFGSILHDASREAQSRNKVWRLGDIAVWKLPSFSFDPDGVDALVDDVVKGAASVVLDMRGNGGGAVVTLQKIIGRLFDHEIKLADVKGRKATTPLVAKSRKAPFTGRLVVLVDSNSGSAAELLARILQIEKRATVIGDQTAGTVMLSSHHPMSMGLDTMIFYSASITGAALIMPDGKSLDKVGVTPDERLLPTAGDLAASRDPVLARAVSVLGGTLDPQAAGKLFPAEWR